MHPTRRQLLAALAALPAAAALSPWLAPLARAGSPKDVATWAPAIDAFEARDQASPPPRDAVLFVGSSSIRKWSTLDRDLAPLSVINRGFGGAHLPHVTHYAPRIVLPYAPAGIVLYAGDNDVAWGASAQQVHRDFLAFHALIQDKLPGTPLWFLAIKPSPLRWEKWPEMQRANALIAEHIGSTDGVGFVDVASPLLDARGQPLPARFASDGLHLSQAGYRAWTQVVRKALAPSFPVLKPQAQPVPVPG